MDPVCHFRYRRLVFDVVEAGIPQGMVATGGKAQTVGSIASVGGEGDGIAFAEDGTHAELIIHELATDKVCSIGEGVRACD